MALKINRSEITQELVKEYFSYKDGYLYWKKITPKSTRKVGDRAGYQEPGGYCYIYLHGILILAHRLIFLYHHNYLPKYIDHINQNKGDNRIENLRAVTFTQNMANTKSKRDTTSKYKGVHWNKRDKAWVSQIKAGSKRYNLGYFKTEEEAARAYDKKAAELFNEYACLNEVTKNV